MSEKRQWHISRRGFLIGFGATAVAATTTFALGTKIGLTQYRESLAQDFVYSNETPNFAAAPGFWTEPDTWFEISTDNRVTFYSSKVEMGQGVLTALGQIAADELSVAWEDLDIVTASTAREMNDWIGTGNSISVASLYPMIREAAATLRELLLQEAAVQLAVAVGELEARDTAVFHKTDPTQSITYGELVPFADSWEVPAEPPTLKNANELQLIGQSVPRVDFLEKLLGKAQYGYDQIRPNMLYGAVARPPTIEGTLRRASDGDALSDSGVQAIIIEDDFVGVVAESRLQAYTGLQQLALEWDEGKRWQQTEIDDLVTVGNGLAIVIQEDGNTDLNANDTEIVSLELRTPLAAHAHLEPQAALADVQADKVDIWMSTQAPFRVRDLVAAALGRDPSSIAIHPVYLGGGFGRKLNSEAGVEAARLSQAAGKPVHVGWNRTEDLRHGFFRPPTHHVLRGKVDENGRIQTIEHQVASSDVLLSLPSSRMDQALGIDAGIYRGATIQYAVPNRRVTAYKVDLPVKTGPWRGLGLFANTFAVESFVDMLATQAKMDPIAFRLLNLPDTALGVRFKNVLQMTAEQSNWDAPLPEGRARGVALALDVHTVVAEVAEVSVENGRMRVHKMTVAIDPGKVINPDGVKAQVEGSIIMGLSSTFYEKITIKDGQVEAANFDGYPLLTMHDAPEVEVVLVESGETPYGIGEPPIGPVAAAVGNAYFALTGERVTQLPMQKA